MRCRLSVFLLSTVLASTSTSTSTNVTFTNPVIPGSNPDPSCIFADDLSGGTFLCVTSSFLSFPGMPIHASKDLINWRLTGHVFNRPEQYPSFGNITNQQFGVYAPTLRYHDGVFYVTTTIFGKSEFPYLDNVVFHTTDPFDDASWGLPVSTGGMTYDNSLFWDKDSNMYSHGASGYGITQCSLQKDPYGQLEDCPTIWNGTGGVAPEGPHMYLINGTYYLMIAEGGDAPKAPTKHHESIARSDSINGPFVPNPSNPLISSVNTTEYITGPGHADIFQDAEGNWWGMALATRSGSEFETFPMGRETVLFPVSWDANGWPVFSQVRGVMSGPLPPRNREAPGIGPMLDDSDYEDFKPNSTIPKHFAYWRLPVPEDYTVSPPSRPNTLRLTPSVHNLTSNTKDGPDLSRTFISRRQTDTLFTYSVDISLENINQTSQAEAGVFLFVTQEQHVSLSLHSQDGTSSLRFRLESKNSNTSSPYSVQPLSSHWTKFPIRFEIRAINITHFTFSAGVVDNPYSVPLQTIATAPGSAISGGYTGAFVGAFATTNGEEKRGWAAYLSRWRYLPQGQYLGDGQWVYRDV